MTLSPQTPAPIQKGILELFWETGMDYSRWTLFKDQDDLAIETNPYARSIAIEPGDSLLVFKPGTLDLERVDPDLFHALACKGREALVDSTFKQELVFGTDALAMDYACNRTDILSQSMKNIQMRHTLAQNSAALIADLLTPGHDLGETVAPSVGVRRLMPLPQPRIAQQLHGATVHGIPETIQPNLWFKAFAGEYPALLVKSPAPTVA